MSGHGRTGCLVWLVAALAVAPRAADDWPQFLGPHRNGVYDGPALAESWPQAGPPVVWKKDVGQGFAGPVVAGGRVILFHRVGREEVVEALDARTGSEIWRFAYRTSYRDDFGFDEGPRSVPVVADGRVYTFGAEGQLHALDLESGRQIWSEDTMRRFRVRKGFFGAAGSPLVENGRVMTNVGGRDAGIVAFDAESGKVLWTATNHEASYSSPVGATIGDQRYAVFFTRNGLVGLEPETGDIRFDRRWRSRLAASVNAAAPLVIGDVIFISASYGTGAGAFRLTPAGLTELWTSDDVLSNHYATSVYYEGHLYGFHGRQEYTPSFRAVELETGKVRWNLDGFRAGTVTLAGGLLVIVREVGDLVLVEASPEEFRPIARAQILPPVIRAYPALADGFLFVRNENMLVCLDLRKGR